MPRAKKNNILKNFVQNFLSIFNLELRKKILEDREDEQSAREVERLEQLYTLGNVDFDSVIIIDFGSQVTQLIARRLRELKVYCEIHPFNKFNNLLMKKLNPKAIILSGGPASVLDKDAPRPPSNIFELGIPILGISYGQQIMVEMLGGTVSSGHGTSEFGKSFVKFKYKKINFLQCYLVI